MSRSIRTGFHDWSMWCETLKDLSLGEIKRQWAASHCLVTWRTNQTVLLTQNSLFHQNLIPYQRFFAKPRIRLYLQSACVIFGRAVFDFSDGVIFVDAIFLNSHQLSQLEITFRSFSSLVLREISTNHCITIKHDVCALIGLIVNENLQL